MSSVEDQISALKQQIANLDRRAVDIDLHRRSDNINVAQSLWQRYKAGRDERIAAGRPCSSDIPEQDVSKDVPV